MLQRYTMVKTEPKQEEMSEEEKKEAAKYRKELLRKKYSFFVDSNLGMAINDLGLLMKGRDETWQVDNWFVLTSMALASSFPFQPGPRRWPTANANLPCIFFVNGLLAERIFQHVRLPSSLIWEDEDLGTCVWTLGITRLGEFPKPM